MQLLGSITSLLSLLAASGLILSSLPGAAAAPVGNMAAKKRANWWVPTQSTIWQIQLSGNIDKRFNGDAIEIDADTNTATVSSFTKRGIKVLAYISAGSMEDWRSDAGRFPASVVGKNLDGWPGEKWLDVRQISILKPIMAARAATAKAKGFDGIDWDNVDGYTQKSGFSINYAQQIAFNKMLADITHGLGMTVALKNDLDQAADLQPVFDLAVNEQCSFYRECSSLSPFLRAGKAVVGIEYPGQGSDRRTNAQVKAQTDPRTYTLIKRLNLGAWGIAVRSMKSVLSVSSKKSSVVPKSSSRGIPSWPA
ncbi:hypothetical protein DRE_06986 [Drechslerella stenobrocha 248]|uniref:alpha-galactosidase n=1 Tax=Drechslerella stenobrocha 248 TaxID=1043628 RepID=W7HJN6_9PEZI|nr:hypothetical protein DRE_06986 [Drechslerella stenobrocha 248]